MSNNLVLLVGSGYMATEYARVLNSLGIQYEVVGRGIKNCRKIQEKFSAKVHSGGIENFISNNTLSSYSHIINTVNIDLLYETTLSLIDAGGKKILLEKPGDLSAERLKKISYLSKKNNVETFIAYNRRFYSSIKALKKMAVEDGGIIGAHFEFTEWIHTIKAEDYHNKTLNKWIIANSSHVIDTVFFIIGQVEEIYTDVYGENKIEWHPSGSTFVGHGRSIKNIPFTYHSNWESAGRWSIEILSKKHRYYLCPMEILKKQKIGSLKIDQVDLDYSYDENYKPGVYFQIKNFLYDNYKDLCPIDEQVNNISEIYNKIGNY